MKFKSVIAPVITSTINIILMLPLHEMLLIWILIIWNVTNMNCDYSQRHYIRNIDMKNIISNETEPFFEPKGIGLGSNI